MKENNTHKDEAMRIAIGRKIEASGQPGLSDGFADRLMQRIEAEEKPSKRLPPDWWQNAVSVISTIAAVLVVVSFIRLQLPSSTEKERTYTYYNIGRLPKSSTLEQVYTSRSEQKKSHQLSYTHFRQLIYEHK